MASEVATADASGGALTAAQRARMERQRQRARALHDARLAGARGGRGGPAPPRPAPARDTGGGFLLEEEPAAPRAPAHAPAPLAHRSLQPDCLECGRALAHSYLLDTFDYSVCDECRDDAEAHALVTRTEAKEQYLLKDCDLDKRSPALRCVRRRNPHRAHYSDMRLYLRAQVAERALQVWGDEAALEAERAAREERRLKAAATAERRRLRELRLAARSSLVRTRGAAPHQHAWGPERLRDEDLYERACTTCGHVETYEKM
ncbi:LOW QUALITY PROTEIN: DNA repair protein complementing XP-A cells homolog [Choristoneura fumiferana]|uniref:LOW QUALITY PROTEIN: DNA repair protein complementing XP-A cells homolog n=1 Tax=Choristoneura fumiferana TaxID=7141 RepID=UPI003D15B343